MKIETKFDVGDSVYVVSCMNYISTLTTGVITGISVKIYSDLQPRIMYALNNVQCDETFLYSLENQVDASNKLFELQQDENED